MHADRMNMRWLSAAVLALVVVGCTQKNSTGADSAGATRALLMTPVDGSGYPVSNVVDADTDTGIPLSSRQVLSVPLARTARVLSVAAYVTGPVRMAARLHDAQGSSVADGSADLAGGGWMGFSVVGDNVKTVKLSLDPRADNVSIREVAVWAEGTSPVSLPGAELLARIKDPAVAMFVPEPDHGTLAPGGTGDADRASSTCVNMVVNSPVNPGQLARALLVFEARNVADSYSVELAVNEFGPVEALLVPISTELKSYYRRFSTSWLKTGRNEVSICGPTAGALNIQVQGIRLVVEAWRAPVMDPELDTPERVLVDGHEDVAAPGEAFHFPAQRTFALHALTLRYQGDTAPAATVEVDGQAVQPSFTSAAPNAVRLMFTAPVQVNRGLTVQRAPHLTDVEIHASPVGPQWPRPALILDHPHYGEHNQGLGVITGFVEGFQGLGSGTFVMTASGASLLSPVETVTRNGAFVMTVNRAEYEGSFAADVSVVVGDVQLTRHVVFVVDAAGNGDSDNGGHTTPGLDPEVERRLYGAEGDQARANVTSESGGDVVLGERVSLKVPPGAVDHARELRIKRPPRSSLARLNPGMVNVTAPLGAGYQFLPSGTHFATKVTVTLPYDPTLIPRGMGAQDVRTYFYSTDKGEYVPLERVLVDPNQQVVRSLTSHFTDMINAVLVQPESTTPQSFNPNRVTGLAVANPMANMTLVAPPTPNKDGTANISYPIQLPKARGSYQPQLALSYSSEGGWGLAGEGWNLSVPTIEVDTRYGAARYEGPGFISQEVLNVLNPLLTSLNVPAPPSDLFAGERYLLDGQQLVPTNSDGPCLGSDERGTLFRLRKEGRFARIVRCRAVSGPADNPHDDYYWIVTEKDGTKMVFGWDEDSRLQEVNCPPRIRNIGRWYLDHVIDADGNGTLYSYNMLDEPCLNLHEPAAERTLKRIDYTFHGDDSVFPRCSDASSCTIPTGHYAVEMSYTGRKDVRIDGKLGFLNQQTQLLSSITVRCHGAACGLTGGSGGGDAIIRDYILDAHADKATMFKMQLDRINSCAPATDCQLTSFTYGAPRYEMGNPAASDPLEKVEFWRLPNDSAAALNVTQAINIGASAGMGVGPAEAIDSQKGIILSGTLGGSMSASATLVSFVDLNGDGLPDQVVSLANGVAERVVSGILGQAPLSLFGGDVAFNTGKPGEGAFRMAPLLGAGDAGPLPTDVALQGPVLPPPTLGMDLSVGLSASANLHAGIDYIGSDANAGLNASISAGIAFPTDVNGDGLIDFVAGPVNFIQKRIPVSTDGGHGDMVVFVPEPPVGPSAGTCAVPASLPGGSAGGSPDGGARAESLDPMKLLEQVKELVSRRDQVLRWRAPRTGEITVNIRPDPLLECSQLGAPADVEVLLIPHPPIPSARQMLEAMADRGMEQMDKMLHEMDRYSGTNLGALLDTGSDSTPAPTNEWFADSVLVGVSTEMVHERSISAGAELLVRIPSTNRCADLGGLADAQVLELTVTYKDTPGAATDPTGHSQTVYSSSNDFRVVGNATPLILPYDGTVSISGGLRVQGSLADDVVVKVMEVSCGLPSPQDLGLPALDPSDPDRFGDAFDIRPETLVDNLSNIIKRLKRACPGVVPIFSTTIHGGAHNGTLVPINIAAEHVNPGALLAVSVEGKTLIDPAAITVTNASGTPGRFEATYTTYTKFNGLNPNATETPSDHPVFEVPVAIGWRRLVPVGGSYQTVSLGNDKKVQLDMLMAPSTWTSGSSKAHLVVQGSGGLLLARVPLEATGQCPTLPALTPMADNSTGCPNIAELQCLPGKRLTCHLPDPDNCEMVQCDPVTPSCPGFYLRCESWADACPLGTTITSCGMKGQFLPCAPSLGDICNVLCQMPGLPCRPSECSDATGCTAKDDCPAPDLPTPCDVLSTALGFIGSPARATADLTGLANEGDQVFISLEPGESALAALWPAPWDIPAVLEKLDPTSFDFPQWVLGEALLLVPSPLLQSLTYRLKTGGSEVPYRYLNRLIPDGTWEMPLPIPVFSTIGAVAAEGWRNWSYAEFIPSPPGIPGGQDTLHKEFAALQLAYDGVHLPTLFDAQKLDDGMRNVAGASTLSAKRDALKNMAGGFAEDINLPPAPADVLAGLGNGLTAIFTPFNFIPQLIPLRPTGPPLAGAYVGLCPESTSARGVVTPGRCIPELPMAPSMFTLGPPPEIRTQALQLMACPLGAPRVSVSGGASVGSTALSFGTSAAANASVQIVDYRDMTGDGVPDIVLALGPMLVLRADRSPGARLPYKPHYFGAASLNKSVGGNHGLNADLSPAARMITSAFGASQVSERIPGSITPSAMLGINAGAVSFQDVNGDGLADWVGSAPCGLYGGMTVRLNLGSRLEDRTRCWDGGSFSVDDAPAFLTSVAGALKGMVPQTFSMSLEGQLGLGAGMSALPRLNSVHGNVNASRSDVFVELQDINGDGLLDRVMMLDDQHVLAFLNTGRGFDNTPVSWSSIGWADQLASAGIMALGALQKTTDGELGVSIPLVNSPLSLSLGTKGGKALNLFAPTVLDALKGGGTCSSRFCDLMSFVGQKVTDNWGVPDSLSTTTTIGVGGGAGGSGTVEDDIQAGPIPILFGVTANGGGNVGGTITWSNAVFVDINGDGAPEPVRMATVPGIARALVVKKNQVAGALKLQTITNPLGGTITLGYTHAGNTFDMPQHRWVLSEVRTDSGVKNGVDDTGNLVNGGSRTTVRYASGKFDRLNKDFRGFQRVIVEERPLGSSDTIIRSRCTEHDVNSYERAGLVLRNATYEGWVNDQCVGALLEEETTDYTRMVLEDGVNSENLCPRPAPLPSEDACRSTAWLMSHTETRSLETNGVSSRRSLSVLEYDAYGNAVRVVDHKRTDDPTDNISMTVVYAPVVGDRYLPSLPTRVLIADATSGDLLRVREGTYDVSGNLDSWSAVGQSERLRTTYAYDAFGNRIQERGPSGYTVNAIYDTETGTLPVRVWDNLDVSEETVFDLALQAPKRVTDANGAELAMDYDGRGRLTALYGPVDEVTGAVKKDTSSTASTLKLADVTYGCGENQARCARVKQVVLAKPTVEVFTYVDGLGRELWKAKTATKHIPRVPPPETEPGATELATGYAFAGLHHVDGLGRKVAVGLVAFSKSTTFDTQAPFSLVNPTVATFDPRNRPMRVRAPAETPSTYFETSTSYQAEPINGVPFLTTVTTDPNGEVSSVTRDPAGDQTVLVREYPRGVGGNPAETRYTFNGLNELLSIHDAANNETAFAYDALGRRTRMSTPDTGTTTYRYDAAGRTTEVENTASGIVRQEYETNSTRVTAVKMMHNGVTTTRATYTYGRANASSRMGVGRVVERSDEDGTDSLKYDALGNVSSSKRLGHVTDFTWDAFGRAIDITYPGRNPEQVSYKYDDAGQVIIAKGASANYVSHVEYDEYGLRTSITFGNGAVQTFRYSDRTRRLSMLAARTSATTSGNNLLHQALSYDSVGNIIAITGALDSNADTRILPTTIDRVFTYDHLHRLTSANTKLGLGGAFPKEQRSTYTFNDIHNMLEKHQQVFDVDGTENEPARQFFTFAYPDKPHTLKTITQQNTNGPDSTHTFVHDDAGRLIESTDWRSHRTFSWAPDNMMVEALLPTETVSYKYDARGNRMGKVTSKGAFHFLGPQATVTPNGLDRHIWVGGTRVATVAEAGTPLAVTYLTDHLGSTSVLLNGNGSVREYIALDPYGGSFYEGRSTTVLDEQFLLTGQMYEPETRFYWFQDAQFNGGGRYFDDEIPRWVSPDPEWAKQGPIGLSVFHYGMWNPIRVTDPDGRCLPTAAAGAAIGAAVYGARSALMGEKTSAGGYFAAAGVGAAFGCGVGFFSAGAQLALGVGATAVQGTQAVAEAATLVEEGVTDANLWGVVALDAALAGAGAAGAARAGRNLGDPLKGVSVNQPGNKRGDCVNCAVAADAVLEGNPATAMPSRGGGGQPLSVLEKHFGGVFKAMRSQGDVEAAMTEAGSGARGIVFGSYGRGQPGHVFNVVNEGGNLRFIDTSTGKNATFQGMTNLQLLMTSGGGG